MTRDIQKRDRRDNNHFSSNQRKVAVRSVGEELEAKLGFDLFNEGDKCLCWLLTFASDKMEIDVKAYLRRRYENDIIEIEIVDKEDLDLVAGFGLAKFSLDTDTHVSTRVMGTFRPVNKAHPFADDSMVEWVRPLLAQALESRSFDVLVDPRLHEYDSSEMATMIACAAACVRHSARLRPQMSQGLFETACDYAREHGGLLWEESKKMRLVVKTEVHVHMREHIHQQKY
ncbi:hypothetical protein Droror1_Dr00017919 [Drosera rotundifolia]